MQLLAGQVDVSRGARRPVLTRLVTGWTRLVQALDQDGLLGSSL